MTIYRDTYDTITMKAKAKLADGRVVDVHGTYCWAPALTWYNDTDRCWHDGDWTWGTSPKAAAMANRMADCEVK